jgi:hypothetical protein
MKLTHPVVLLLGAGATRGGLQTQSPPPPVDMDFFEIAGQIKGHGTPKLAHTVLEDVLKLYGRLSGVGLEGYYRDIETRAKIGSFATTANKPKDWQKRQARLEELIRRVIIHTTCKEQTGHLKPRNSIFHANILSKLKKDDSILTFNYDLLIEESFKAADIWTPIGGYGKATNEQRSEWSRNWLKARNGTNNPRAKIRLLKLHGSVNWTRYQDMVRLKDRPFVVRTRKGKAVAEKVSILPPGWNKQIDKNPYKQLWKAARLRLEQCKTLIIVGYSLPETDLLAKALFAEVVRTRKARKHYVKELHLADPNDAVKQKLIEMFVPALNAQSKVFRYRDIKELASA